MIKIITPQFERSKSDAAAASPPSDWEAMRTMNVTALLELGLRKWDEPKNGTMLMRLPGEWYRDIPKGFELECSSGEVEGFVPGVTDNDIRFGCLAYGIRVRS